MFLENIFSLSIDGIGDEVLYCFFTLGFATLIYAVWSTTFVNDTLGTEPFVRQEQPSHPENPSESVQSETEETSTVEEPDPPESEEAVRIRLKFLDESVKEVRSHLSESFGRFKRRHFLREIQDNQIIRLVFNGRFLDGDSRSLDTLGLFDNCVCHVLIQSRPPPNTSNPGNNGGSSNSHTGPANAQNLVTEDLDLSTVCYPLLGSLLSLIWWCQIVYGQYFNLTSTLSLISITGLYIFCLAGQLY
ncbi:transmembrane and ubiquitin-like domain-containing protein 1 [Lepeophtheirus salmonis]|uniref:Transmembrane and ubiquitin-like domain-containing protein 1 n=1 Tax=Lepeophtheirus salmonis TaxID=72036 RepID=D3PJW1_LEPSM|nr:transmembrane and ubiquitin-like domain-containing protein 1 [Lepeophtheirus salmonis]ADD38847.1 Transmembrane and ubiquitin-like domain-containing protein 1 [Lepeophtheirus salmonis]